METRSVRIAATLVLLLAILMTIFACNSQPDQAKNVGLSKDPPVATAQDPCAGTNSNNRKQAIENYVTNVSMGDNSLNNQRSSNNFVFYVEEHPISATDTNTWILVRARGRVVGVEEGSGPKFPKMKKFLQFLETGMRKGCIDKVSFEPGPEASPSPAPSPSPGESMSALSARGFEWQEACPQPEYPCPGSGLCSVGGACTKGRPGPEPTPTPTPTRTP